MAAATALLLAGCKDGDGTALENNDDDHDHNHDVKPAWTACEHILQGTPEDDTAQIPNAATYDKALQGLNMDEVKNDMTKLLKDSKPCWPADQGNYAGLMIRLTWHCSGSFRDSDGIGGCTGGRMRFEPERSWPDNTNLDKARALLYPMKMKYGDALSWGDLFVLAGTTAYREAGMPISRMCFGRLDEADGSKSKLLGPTAEQEVQFPCAQQGKCRHPLGATTVGLIYVNPGGPLNDANDAQVASPKLSVAEIRRTFETMGHTDRGTVALIGGGHAIGKCHGACPKSPGLSPEKAFKVADGPSEIWKGECGTGTGEDTTTSGFEGYWTTNPYTWDNEFFTDLFDKDWEVWAGPGGNQQWKVRGVTGGLMRLTTDLALLEDDMYRAIAKEFSENMTALNNAFDDAWDKLTTYGEGTWSPQAKCDDGSTPPQFGRRLMRSDDVDFESFV